MDSGSTRNARAPNATVQRSLGSARRLAGRYRLEAELGRGGMGAVYRAWDDGTRTSVALKVLESSDARLIALFEREYQTLAMLAHPRVIEAYDYGLAGDVRYYTMELLDGGDLTTRVPLPWLEVCSLLRDVCTSLVLLHAQKLVHRDVNPRNVRLDQHGRAKLIDFGALTNFGLAEELVGTPACMAPEALRCQPLDQRTDLFSLGAVAYWALTGRIPYAIRRLDEAEQAWRTTPIVPSLIVPTVPKALDELITSLLSIDALGRPASAAEVIDRLGVIGQLDDEALAVVADSHLSSSTMVGRASEQAQLEELLARALRQQGGAAVIAGTKGLGRTRVLSQLAIDARLVGFATLHVAGATETQPGALLGALAARLLEVAPDDARATLGKYLPALTPLIGDALPASELVPEAAPLAPASDKHRMLRLSSALARWILDVSARRPLLLAIDDAHLLHPSSASVLTMIAEHAQAARLFLAVTRLSGAPAPPAVEQLSWLGDVLSLEPIDHAAVEHLAHSIFGDVPHRARVTQWLVETAHGAPGQILERLRELMSRGLIRYAGGAWALPSELNEASLAQAFNKDAAARLARLGTAPLTLAQLLSLHRGSLSETLCLRLLPSSSKSVVREALDELAEARIVLCSGDGYRLAEGGWRELLADTLDQALLPARHRLLANTLLSASRDQFAGVLSSRLERVTTAEIIAAIRAGLHFLRGGERALGTKLLRNGAIALTVRGDDLMAAAPDVEAAIETFRAQGRHRNEYAALMTVLTLAGTYSDWRLSYRYGEELIDVLAELAGIKLASRLRSVLGPKLALGLALGLSFLLFYLLPRRRTMATSFRDVILGLMGIGSAVVGVCPVLQDAARAERIVKQLAPLGWFPRNHVVRVVHEFQVALAEHSGGRYREAVEKGERVLAFVQSKAAAATMPPDARAQFEAGVHIMLGQMYVMRADNRAFETMRALDKLKTATSRQTSTSVRVAYHGHRGEHEAFVKNLHEMDRLASQTGAIWRNDVMIPRMLWTTLALCEDVMGLKRGAQQLTPLAAQVPSAAVMRDLTEACYLAEHGLPGEALTRYAPLFEKAIGVHSLRAAQYLGAYARILRKAGQPQRAKEICEQVLRALTPEDHEFALLTIGARMELALSLLALGDHARATELTEALIREQQGHDNPLLHGISHGARAEVALATGERKLFEQHVAAMKEWVRTTQHPALYAQYQRLAERGRTLDTSIQVAAAQRPSRATQTPSMQAAALVSREQETPRALLARLLRDACAEAGYVYLRGVDGSLELSAGSNDASPPAACALALSRLLGEPAWSAFDTEHVDHAREPKPRGDELMTLVEDAAGTPLEAVWPGRACYWFVLSTAARSNLGALLLIEGERPLKRVAKRLLEELAHAFATAPRVASGAAVDRSDCS